MSDLFGWGPRDRHRGGATYQQVFDIERLNGQQRAVWDAVKDGRWRSLAEIATAADADLIDRLRGKFLIDRLRDRGEASASARLRDFRKMGLRVDRKRTVLIDRLRDRGRALYLSRYFELA